jgi:hypothetical protein
VDGNTNMILATEMELRGKLLEKTLASFLENTPSMGNEW